jgi:hypothetical protein
MESSAVKTGGAREAVHKSGWFYCCLELNHRSKNGNDWIIDSGARCHMSGKKKWFGCYNDDQCINITLADNSTIPSRGVGNIPLQFPDDIKMLRNVQHVPGLEVNLVSVSIMTNNNLAVKR